ncbi:MAG: (Fe-S)-binding protein [Promethearchaeota archaeon]
MVEKTEELKNLSSLKDAAIACAQCGMCRVANWPSKGIFYVCPVLKTDSSPQFEPYFARGKNMILKGLFNGDLKLSREISDLVFQCTLCGACYDFCFNTHRDDINFPLHSIMDQVNVYEALRADLVAAGVGLEAHISMNKAMVELLNPYGRDNKVKAEWINKLDFKPKDAFSGQCETLYYVGCTSALTPEIENVCIDTAKILNKLGVDFCVLGEHEVCCGSVAMRSGDRKAFNFVVGKNVEMFKLAGIKTIITSCAGCYRTFKKDYGEKLEGIKIFHSVDYLKKIIEQKNIKLKNLNINTTYHDPCHIGRHLGNMGIYQPPRDILQNMSELVEMKTNRAAATCCGAGGGVKKGFPELSLEMAENRIKEAEETGAQYLVSTCPFCDRNLSDAIKSSNSELKMVDLVELILESIS